MKYLLFILSLAGLVVSGCRSNSSNQNENPAAADTVAVVKDTAAEDVAALPVITEPVAYQAWLEIAKSLGMTGKFICPENCTAWYVVELENEEGAEGYMIDDQVFCYPFKDGGVLAVHEHVEAAEGQGGEYDYNYYIYKDGALSKVENDMPIPEFLDLVVDPEERRGQDDVLARLENLYKENPRGILEYIFSPEDGIVKVQLHPLSYGEYIEPDENGKYKWLEQFWEMRKDSDANVYRWNGEKFVKVQQ